MPRKDRKSRRVESLSKPLQIRISDDQFDRLPTLAAWRRRPSVSEWLRDFIRREERAYEKARGAA
jgi:class 3 adenylate cyclase